jgi:hypothetical protein
MSVERWFKLLQYLTDLLRSYFRVVRNEARAVIRMSPTYDPEEAFNFGLLDDTRVTVMAVRCIDRVGSHDCCESAKSEILKKIYASSLHKTSILIRSGQTPGQWVDMRLNKPIVQLKEIVEESAVRSKKNYH